MSRFSLRIGCLKKHREVFDKLKLLGYEIGTHVFMSDRLVCPDCKCITFSIIDNIADYNNTLSKLQVQLPLEMVVACVKSI